MKADEKAAKGRSAIRPKVWWCIVVALVLHVSAWVCWFHIASMHPVAEVPLATKPHR